MKRIAFNLGALSRPLALAVTAAFTFCISPAAFAACSTSAWDSESGTVQAIGVSTVPTGLKYEGECGLTVDAAVPGYVTTTAPADEPMFSARFYFYPHQFDLSSGDAEIFEARNGNVPQLRVSLREAGGALRIVTSYRSGGSLIEHGTTVPAKTTWQAVTVSWTTGSGDGSLSLRLDGAQQLALGGLDNGGEVVNQADLGILNTPSGIGKLVFDAFEMRRTVNEPPLLAVNELFNISTRAEVGNGPYAVVAGFIIDGDTEKCVVIRSRGQSLNINTTRLADPTLTLKRAGNPTVLEFNDDWQDHPTAGTVQALGRAPGHPSEAAFFRCLQPGAYTAELRGVLGTELGLGIVEVIDQDQGTPYLFNISTRAKVITGARRVVAGFIIEGEQSRRVLIRGRGPTVNVSRPTLADPSLELRQGSTVLAQNDDWGSAANAADIAATGAAPVDASEAAILTTLPPGAYTVFLQSETGEPGIGIIEVIDDSGGSISSN